MEGYIGIFEGYGFSGKFEKGQVSEKSEPVNTKKISLSDPIEAKIAWAEDSYRETKDRLLADTRIDDLLDSLKSAICAAQKEMAGSGIVKKCMECEINEGGSCCGAGIENRYDGVLLLINLFLGVKLPKKRYDKNSCFFLGETGCLLKARHVICVNFLCKKISETIDPHQIALLRKKEGEELNTLFLVHERIKKILYAERRKKHAFPDTLPPVLQL